MARRPEWTKALDQMEESLRQAHFIVRGLKYEEGQKYLRLTADDAMTMKATVEYGLRVCSRARSAMKDHDRRPRLVTRPAPKRNGTAA